MKKEWEELSTDEQQIVTPFIVMYQEDGSVGMDVESLMEATKLTREKIEACAYDLIQAGYLYGPMDGEYVVEGDVQLILDSRTDEYWDDPDGFSL
jgi:chemotaxis signal transduction protein